MQIGAENRAEMMQIGADFGHEPNWCKSAPIFVMFGCKSQPKIGQKGCKSAPIWERGRIDAKLGLKESLLKVNYQRKKSHVWQYQSYRCIIIKKTIVISNRRCIPYVKTNQHFTWSCLVWISSYSFLQELRIFHYNLIALFTDFYSIKITEWKKNKFVYFTFIFRSSKYDQVSNQFSLE